MRGLADPVTQETSTVNYQSIQSQPAATPQLPRSNTQQRELPQRPRSSSEIEINSGGATTPGSPPHLDAGVRNTNTNDRNTNTPGNDYNSPPSAPRSDANLRPSWVDEASTRREQARITRDQEEEEQQRLAEEERRATQEIMIQEAIRRGWASVSSESNADDSSQDLRSDTAIDGTGRQSERVVDFSARSGGNAPAPPAGAVPPTRSNQQQQQPQAQQASTTRGRSDSEESRFQAILRERSERQRRNSIDGSSAGQIFVKFFKFSSNSSNSLNSSNSWFRQIYNLTK